VVLLAQQVPRRRYPNKKKLFMDYLSHDKIQAVLQESLLSITKVMIFSFNKIRKKRRERRKHILGWPSSGGPLRVIFI
jgi:hypothetical protein